MRRRDFITLLGDQRRLGRLRRGRSGMALPMIGCTSPGLATAVPAACQVRAWCAPAAGSSATRGRTGANGQLDRC
jgi:hypothetical protein